MQDGMKPLKMLVGCGKSCHCLDTDLWHGVERICLTLTTCSLQDEQKALETLMSMRSALQGKRTELERKIKDLGSLPSEAFEKYRDHSLQELHKLLHKANTQLKKFRCGC